jgi:recombination protein RecA
MSKKHNNEQVPEPENAPVPEKSEEHKAAEEASAKEAEKTSKKAAKEAEIIEKNRRAQMEQLRKIMGMGPDQLYYAGEKTVKLDLIGTGNEEIDAILTPDEYSQHGKGGLPRGYLCEFYGPQAGGKSSLAQMLAATVTKRKGNVLWLDVEGSFYDVWAEKNGIDRNYLVKVEPGAGVYGEYYMEKLESGVKSGMFQLAVLDSLAALMPKMMMEAPLEKETIAARARLLSKTIPRLVGVAKEKNCAIILINQIRMKTGISYGNPEVTPGGEAPGFFASIRVRLKRLGRKDRGIYLNGEEIGLRAHAQTIKNRFGPCYLESMLPMYYGAEKPSAMDQLIDVAITKKVIKVSTSKEEHEPTQSFSLKGFPNLSDLDSFDEFRDRFISDKKAIIEVGKRLREKKGVVINSDIEQLMKETEKEAETEGE